MSDSDFELAEAYRLIADLARLKGVERVAELGTIPPLGSPEFFSWAEREGIDLAALPGMRMAEEDER
jgi:hypothetical protein